MTTIIKTALALMVALCSISACAPERTQSQTEKVYVCHGPKSKRYHKTPNCKGLCRCSTDIRQMTRQEAEAKHYTPLQDLLQKKGGIICLPASVPMFSPYLVVMRSRSISGVTARFFPLRVV